MMWLLRSLFALALFAATVVAARPQEQPGSEVGYEFFSGTIAQFSDSKITVSRNIFGKTENRTFIIKPDTKIEGKLKAKARVTVAFKTTDEGDIAARIIVRAANATTPLKKP